jgi:hypothetical protein
MRLEEPRVLVAAAHQQVTGLRRPQLQAPHQRAPQPMVRPAPPVDQMVLDVVRAQDAELPARGGRTQDGRAEREVRHDRVAPAKLLAQGARQEPLAGRSGAGREAGADPHRRGREDVAGEPVHERRQTAVDALLHAVRPGLRPGRPPGQVIGLAAGERVHADVEALTPQRVDQTEAAQRTARARGVDLQGGEKQHLEAAQFVCPGPHAAIATSWARHHDSST